MVRVTVDRTVALGLGLNDGSEDFVVEVAPGQTIEIPVPGVGTLARIVVGNGEVKTLEDGTMQSVADGVRVEVLPEVEGGVLLSLAHAEASVRGVVPPPPAPAPAPAAQLPRTGSDAPVLIGAVLLAGALGLRRLTVARKA